MTTKQYIDTATLSRGPQQVAGQVLCADLERMNLDLPPQQELAVTWSVSGGEDSAGMRLLEVRAQGAVMLECQRCMKPFVWSIDISNQVEVVSDEADLEVEDDAEGPDRILCVGRLDALGLVEDELILSLPYVPMHDECPDVTVFSFDDEDEEAEPVKPSPFAVLGKLKKS